MLSHLRVLDLSRILAGPWASQLLADMGAEVIKVERPGSGDDTRGWGPPFIGGDSPESGTAAYFHGANRGKRSLAVDIGRAEGQQLIRELAAKSDVVIENFKTGTLTRYGLDYASLKALNPGIVCCSITGFGQTGPYRQRAGYDFLIQAMGGLMSITGEADGRPGGGPQKVGVALADVMTGLYATIGILAALAHRERTGEGQHVDLALLDVQVATLANQAMNFLASGKSPVRLGNAHPNIVPYQAFEANDGHLIVAVGNDQQFRRFCRLLGQEILADDPRYATNAARVRHRDLLVPALAEALAKESRAHWLSVMEAEGVPGGPINAIGEVFADPQVQARGMRIAVPDGHGEQIPGVANPIRFSATPVKYTRAAPVLGADTEAVLSEVLNLDGERLQTLRRDGVIG